MPIYLLANKRHSIQGWIQELGWGGAEVKYVHGKLSVHKILPFAMPTLVYFSILCD